MKAVFGIIVIALLGFIAINVYQPKSSSEQLEDALENSIKAEVEAQMDSTNNFNMEDYE